MADKLKPGADREGVEALLGAMRWLIEKPSWSRIEAYALCIEIQQDFREMVATKLHENGQR